MKHYLVKSQLLLLFILFFSNFIHAQTPNFNLNSIGQLSYTQELNDIWGYVDSTGIEYALVGTTTGTSIVSLADPANPAEVLFIPGSFSKWRDLKTWNNHAYVTCDQGVDGLLIIDLSPLPNGTPTFQFWKPQLTVANHTTTLERAHNLYIDETGFCYIAGSNIGGGVTFILDLNTTPNTPVYVGATSFSYSHDTYVRGDTLWESNIISGAFSAHDISNKANPILLATQNTPDNFTHNSWLSDDGQTLFTTDERKNSWITAYDISDLSNIQELDRYRTPNPDIVPHNVHVLNDYLVTSYYADGLIILDAKHPDNLIEVARYDTYHLPPSVGYEGAWGAYPFLPSGLILVTDMQTGLHIFQPTYQRACWLEGLITDQTTSATLFDVEINIITPNISTKTNFSGLYKTGISTSGTYNVEFKKVGYLPQIIPVTLINGQVVIQNVQLVPSVPFTLSGQVVDSLNQTIGISNAILQFKSSLYNYTTTADANGNFSLTIYPDNNYEIIVGQWGHWAKKFTLNALNPNSIPPQFYPLSQGYKDEFVLDYNWIEFGDAASGKWERDTPLANLSGPPNTQPESYDLSFDLGNQCLITGNTPYNDVSYGTTTIMSPSMDLSTAIDPTLSFYYFFTSSFIAATNVDSFQVYMTNGIDTVTLMGTNIPTPSWSSKQEIRILDFITLTNNMRVYFKVNDHALPNIVEAMVDLFEIRESTTSSVVKKEASFINLQSYPNPFSNRINIDYEINLNYVYGNFLQVHNSLGQLIEQKHLQQLSGSLTLGDSWDSGIYFISIGNQTIKVIKSN